MDIVTYILCKKFSQGYTESAIAAIAKGMTYKGAVGSFADLPLSGNTKGDLYIASDTTKEYVWSSDSDSGTADDWQELGAVDLSKFYTKDEINTLLAKKTSRTYVDAELAKKQNALQEGANIKIEGNVISALISRGLTGPIGPTGAAGAVGPTGKTGAAGPTGKTGATGPTGATGAAGPTGKTGAVGPTGVAGKDGLTTKISLNGQTYEQVDGVITLPELDTTIGKDFTTNITVGYMKSGTVISSDMSLKDILYNILYKAPVKVTSVTLNKSTTRLAIGATETLTATVLPSDADNKSVTWSSSNTAVATVSSSGKITAKSAGTAIITVTTVDQGKTATCSIEAYVVNVESIAVSKSSATITVGNTETLTVAFTPANATNKSIVWTSSDETVATVSNGVITAVGAGNATITATSVDGNKTSTCAVTIEAAPVVDHIYVGASTAVPSSVAGLNDSGVSGDDIVGTHVFTILCGTGAPDYDSQYTVIACPKAYKLTDWMNDATGISYWENVHLVETDDYNIYYKTPVCYDEDLGGEAHRFIFTEA